MQETTLRERAELALRLEKAAEEVARLEIEAAEAELKVAAAKAAIDEAEARLVLSGQIDGKNAEIRAAQLAMRLADERQVLRQAQQDAELAKARLAQARHRFAALRAIAQLMAGAGEVA